MSKYCIEIAGKQNEQAKFSPTGDKLRGRWTASNVAHRDKGEAMKAMSRIEAIPGQYVELDTNKKQGRIFDPLSETPEGKRIWKEVEDVLRRFQSVFGGRKRLETPKVVSELSADQVKTWAFHMRTLIDTGMARYVAGSDELPDVQTIRHKWPGRRMTDPLATSGRFEAGKWSDEVPEKGRELAGAGAGGGGGGGQGGSGGSGGDGGKK